MIYFKSARESFCAVVIQRTECIKCLKPELVLSAFFYFIVFANVYTF